MRLKVIRLIILMMILAILASCSPNKKEDVYDDSNTTTIVTSFYPMYIFTKNIVKDTPNVKIVNLTPPQTGCLHDYQITPQDLMVLEKADIFVINGADMESFMDKVIKQYPSLKVVEASRGMDLIKENESYNAHIWVSVSGAIQEVKNIGQQLIDTDMKNAETYKQNMNNFIGKLENLKEKMHKELSSIPNKDIVTFHEAFPYFAREFNLNIAAVVEREPGSEPSAQELAKTIDIVKKSNVKALFAEPQYPIKSAQAISKETGAKLYILDPFVNGADDSDAYIKTMENNFTVLKEALK